MNLDFFQCDAIQTQYYSIPCFNHSPPPADERGERFSSAQRISPCESDFAAQLLVEVTGSIFGMAALTKLRRYDVTAKCIEHARTLALDSAKLNRIVRKDTVAGLEVMAELAQLYLNRLNATRMQMSNLLRIFRVQDQKTPITVEGCSCL